MLFCPKALHYNYAQLRQARRKKGIQMRVKLIFLMSVTLLMTLAVSAQTVTLERPVGKTDVPSPVLKAFKSAYPQASARSYMKVEVNGVPFYRIASLEKDLHRNVTYNPDGSVAKLEERIAANELPAVAQQAIQEKYPKAKVARAEKVTQGDRIEYKADVRKGGKSFDLFFDADGKLISAREVKVNIVMR